jgi:uncharacterized protein (TIGR00299 family) protein
MRQARLTLWQTATDLIRLVKALYLDLFSGISGDMFLGALIDLGVDARQLERDLGKLKLTGYHIHSGRQENGNISGIKFDVHLESHHHHASHDAAHHHEAKHNPGGAAHSHTHEHEHEHARTFSAISELILRSDLPKWVKEKSIAVFQRIAVAEGKIHGLPPEKVHFHEVGAVDSIVDIVGACVALEMMGRPRIFASHVVEGTGFFECAHGRFPIPAPATLAILAERRVPFSQCDEPNELVTPTGAALIAEFAEAFGPAPGLTPEKVGYGLGTRRNKTRPNVLRAILGEVTSPNTPHDWEVDTVAVLETNLDDISPEILGDFMERALAAGALDVFHTPIQMKKNRPGALLSILCAENAADNFSEMLLRETSAFGVRRHQASRRKLLREFTEVETRFGKVTIKLGKLDGKLVQAAPEFSSCKKLADQAGVPLKEVYLAAIRALGNL